MASASIRLSEVGERLSRARERFLASEPVDPAAVREPILASWRRSRKSNVPAGRLDLSFLRAPDLESPLARAADPVLRELFESLEGQPVSVVLTDASGLLVYRLTGDRQLERQLDSMLFAPGFCYAESAVGTNGIGTALETGEPAEVFGHEHYAEQFEGMACAGAPVLDPVTGKTVGVVDLTCGHRHADPLMLSLARSTALHVHQALAAACSDRDLRLLQEYTRACRPRGSIVLGLGGDVVMLNDRARQALSPGDQTVLISHAVGMLERRRSPGAVTMELPSGVVARMFCHPVGETGAVAGHNLTRDGVVHVKLLAPASAATAVPPPRQPAQLPGLVGSGAVWRRALGQADAACHRGDWLAMEGESGVGKLALIRAVHQRHQPAAPFHVLDAANGGDDLLARARGELADGSGMLVLRHVHALDAGQARALAGALREARAAGRDSVLRVAVTLDRAGAGLEAAHRAGDKAADVSEAVGCTQAEAEAEDAGLTEANAIDVADLDIRSDGGDLLRLFPAVVAVPPLRHHSEDLRELVPFFLGRLSKQGQVSCSPAAMQLLVRYAWPGNAAQLWQVLKQAVQRRRVGQIMPDDLPSEVWTVSRRVLSPLESIERDAIVQSLFDHGGSKIRAARALGMSRATMYRRIREYGIVT